MWVGGFFLFLLNYEMTHASQLKINLIAAAVGSWQAVMAWGPLSKSNRGEPCLRQPLLAASTPTPTPGLGVCAVGAQVALPGLLMGLKCS